MGLHAHRESESFFIFWCRYWDRPSNFLISPLAVASKSLSMSNVRLSRLLLSWSTPRISLQIKHIGIKTATSGLKMSIFVWFWVRETILRYSCASEVNVHCFVWEVFVASMGIMLYVSFLLHGIRFSVCRRFLVYGSIFLSYEVFMCVRFFFILMWCLCCVSGFGCFCEVSLQNVGWVFVSCFVFFLLSVKRLTMQVFFR